MVGIYVTQEVMGNTVQSNQVTGDGFADLWDENISRHGIAAGVPAYMVEKSDRVKEAHRESFRKAVRAGVRTAQYTLHLTAVRR